MNFETALPLLKQGKALRRTGWNGKDLLVELYTPNATERMTMPYLYLFTVMGNHVPWVPSISDVLENDWEQVAVDPPRDLWPTR